MAVAATQGIVLLDTANGINIPVRIYRPKFTLEVQNPGGTLTLQRSGDETTWFDVAIDDQGNTEITVAGAYDLSCTHMPFYRMNGGTGFVRYWANVSFANS